MALNALVHSFLSQSEKKFRNIDANASRHREQQIIIIVVISGPSCRSKITKEVLLL